ncbi:hypothetical protein So717_17230 [Roseobacter cerasinus]|uniref:Uncharacterized protein n=1 Tax=Roseobacter cerasinus TaxID=2602289 RepID=A0A640VRB3_9RHOB|nr:hypothetical protein [Roseobacter cerasinus]GFE49970.1 hypothetical protein So717_17230 [Roseobacter cerasinus]
MTDKEQNNDVGCPSETPAQRTLEDELLEEFGDDPLCGDLDEEQARAFLMTFWNIVTIFAELGVSVAPINGEAVDNTSKNLRALRVDVLSLLTKEDTAHETVAPRSTQNDEAHPCRTPNDR